MTADHDTDDYRPSLAQRIAYRVETELWYSWFVQGPDRRGDVIEFVVKDLETNEEALVKIIRAPSPAEYRKSG